MCTVIFQYASLIIYRTCNQEAIFTFQKIFCRLWSKFDLGTTRTRPKTSFVSRLDVFSCRVRIAYYRPKQRHLLVETPHALPSPMSEAESPRLHSPLLANFERFLMKINRSVNIKAPGPFGETWTIVDHFRAIQEATLYALVKFDSFNLLEFIKVKFHFSS
jgi:hypothetical protein